MNQYEKEILFDKYKNKFSKLKLDSGFQIRDIKLYLDIAYNDIKSIWPYKIKCIGV